jgi:DNA-directed RNA polymerase specialized sigma24 family protein
VAAGLTSRDVIIFFAVIEANQYEDAAKRLGVGRQHVKNRMYQIRSILGVATNEQAMLKLWSLG